jgi:hypothetical protein
MSRGTAGRYRKAVRMRHFRVRNQRRASRRISNEAQPVGLRCDHCGNVANHRYIRIGPNERLIAECICQDCEYHATEGWF